MNQNYKYEGFSFYYLRLIWQMSNPANLSWFLQLRATFSFSEFENKSARVISPKFQTGARCFANTEVLDGGG